MQFAEDLGWSTGVRLDVAGKIGDPVNPFTGFFEEKWKEFGIAQIFVQLRRFTSTPRVPTISSLALRTATAIVKQGSPVNRES